jgi:beta-galactosidase
MRAGVAILYDYNSLWALETQPNTDDGFNYIEMASAWDQTLARLGVVADAVSIHADLDRYKVLIAPTVHICSPETADRLKAHVRAGGTLILGPRSGVKEEEGAIVEALLPGLLRDLAGCTVEEYDAFSRIPGLEMHVQDAAGNAYLAHGLADVLAPEGEALALLTYTAHYYAGKPAAVENRYSGGQCFYLGTVLEADGLAALLGPILAAAHVPTLPDLPDCVEVSYRDKGDQRYTFYLNHSNAHVCAPSVRAGVDLLTGAEVASDVEIPGFGVVVVKETNAPPKPSEG